MSDETVELIDGESATETELDDGISLGAPSLRAALEALLMVTEEPMSTSTLATLTHHCNSCVLSLNFVPVSLVKAASLQKVLQQWPMS